MCCVVVLQYSQYIAACKKRQHIIPDTLTDYIVGQYVEMRRDARNNRGGINQTFTSARTLLALLRLSTALVRGEGGGATGEDLHLRQDLVGLAPPLHSTGEAEGGGEG